MSDYYHYNNVNGFFTDKMFAAYGIEKIKNKFTVDRHIQCDYEKITRSSETSSYGISYSITNGGRRDLVTIDGCNRIVRHHPNPKEESVRLTITMHIDDATDYEPANIDWKNNPYTIDKIIHAITDAYISNARTREINGFSTKVPMYLEFSIILDDFLENAYVGMVYVHSFGLSIRNKNYGIKDYADIRNHFHLSSRHLSIFDPERDVFTVSFIVEEHSDNLIPPLWVMDAGEPVRVEKRENPVGLPDGLYIISRRTYGLDLKRIYLSPDQIRAGEAKQYGYAFTAGELTSGGYDKAYTALEKENARLKESLAKTQNSLEKTEDAISELKKTHAVQTDDLKRDLREKHLAETNRLNGRISSMTHDAEMTKMQIAELEKKMSDVKRDAVEKSLAESKKHDKELADGLERERVLKLSIESFRKDLVESKKETAEARKESAEVKKKEKEDGPIRAIAAILGLVASALSIFLTGKKLFN